MFHFPYYENDEGTYMSQAWAVLREGRLAPYTYWYDHTPGGWLFIALWVFLTGGFFTFGPSINSGRVFMLVLHLGSTAMLYLISKRITRKSWPGVVAVTIFSLSPLAIYFQRRVLLDNIMVFWILATTLLLTQKPLKLYQVIASALTFSIAVLTKENAIVFAPAFIYLIFSVVHSKQKVFALVSWSALSFFVISSYFLYAFLKAEFFPVGFLGNDGPHVSLISTLKEQMGRGSRLPFWHRDSDFYINLAEWIKKDIFLVTSGFLATFLGMILSIRQKHFRFPTLLSILFILFLIRGALIIDFYLVPLVPIFALLVGMVSEELAKKLSFGNKMLYTASWVVSIVYPAVFLYSFDAQAYTKDETTPQVETIKWIKENLEANTFIAIDDSIWVDLHEPGLFNNKVFKNAEWSWKIEKDPEIKDSKLGNDWGKIEYMALSHEILRQIRLFNNDFIVNAHENSDPVISWVKGSTSHLNLPLYISTNGDWMAIYKVKDEQSIGLNESWKFYKENFIKFYGQVVDPQNGRTTSEGQSYAMLRAVMMDDERTFAGVWAWTKDHMQKRTSDKLISWLWEGESLGDPSTAADADEDVALALVFASRLWNELNYLSEAKEIISDIWDKEVVEIDGRLLLASGSDAKRKNGYLVNPSYFSPASYRIFAQIDREHDWEKLAEDSYYWLAKINEKSYTYLPPNSVFIDEASGAISSAFPYTQDTSSDLYGYDAFRVFFRLSLDAKWFKENKAKEYLSFAQPFFGREWEKMKDIRAVYDLSGNPYVNYSSLSTTTGALFVFSETDGMRTEEVFVKITESFDPSRGFWGDSKNYYDQNWVWFATVFYTGKTQNLHLSENLAEGN